jgi:putative FmdB family regulatory protein
MPVYEYECQACKYYTEVMQKVTDAPLMRCPSCGKRRLRRLVSAPVFRLKGGGWYETDFKSDKELKRNLLAAEKEETKAESKAEAKQPAEAGKAAKEPAESAAGKAESKAAGAESGAAAGGGTAASAPGARSHSAARRPARRTTRRKTRRGRR